jgi:hypothetical protein
MSPIAIRTMLPLAVAVGLATAPKLARSAPQSGQGDARDSVHVTVSRREVRVVFPHDSSREWGWTASRASDYDPHYAWIVDASGAGGVGTIRLDLEREVAIPQRFTGLARLVDVARPSRCVTGQFRMFEERSETRCTPGGSRATVEENHVVLVIDDSATIASLFGFRPEHVSVSHLAPSKPMEHWARVPVRYVGRRLRPDSAAIRAAQRDAGWRFRVRRYIGGNEGRLFVGDTAPLTLAQAVCEYDVCHPGREALSDSGWTLSDRRLARLLPAEKRSAGRADRLMETPSRMIVALRPGRVVVRARGVHGLLDAALESSTPLYDLERTIVILPKPR